MQKRPPDAQEQGKLVLDTNPLLLLALLLLVDALHQTLQEQRLRHPLTCFQRGLSPQKGRGPQLRLPQRHKDLLRLYLLMGNCHPEDYRVPVCRTVYGLPLCEV